MGSLSNLTTYSEMFFSIFLVFCMVGCSQSCISLPPFPFYLFFPIPGRSGAGEKCATLEALLLICPPGPGGYTWADIGHCENNIKDLELPIGAPTEDDFRKIDQDDDGFLTMEELNNFVGC